MRVILGFRAQRASEAGQHVIFPSAQQRESALDAWKPGGAAAMRNTGARLDCAMLVAQAQRVTSGIEIKQNLVGFVSTFGGQSFIRHLARVGT